MRQLGRRGLPALLAGLALPGLARAAPPPAIRFRIMRQGSAIGTHSVTFAETGGALAALTEVDIAVRLVGITVFRMTHRFREVWEGARLREAASRMDRNGRVSEMTARGEEGAVLVQGPAGALRLPPEAAPLSWWDSRRFTRPLFSSSTGQPLRLQWTRTGLPDGTVRWRCTGDDESEGTYAPDGTWLGWTTRGDDGSVVVYERA